MVKVSCEQARYFMGNGNAYNEGKGKTRENVDEKKKVKKKIKTMKFVAKIQNTLFWKKCMQILRLVTLGEEEGMPRDITQ